MIAYNQAKKLKEVGCKWKINRQGYLLDKFGDKSLGIPMPQKMVDELEYVYIPTLNELIEACGDTIFFDLLKRSDGWIATDHYFRGEGSTPEEAVFNLCLAINNK